MLDQNNKSYDRVTLSWPQHEIIKMMRPGSRVLEVGCSTGYMTRVFHDDLNCHVVAVEIDPVEAERARPYADKLLVGDIASPLVWEQIRNEKFDYVIFADVLEHLPDPWEILRRTRDLLNDGGIVLASIPNVAYFGVRFRLLFGIFEYTKFGILDDTHLRFFTKRSVFRLFTSTGYKVDRFMRAYKWGRFQFVKLFPSLFTFQFVIKASVDE